VSKKPKRPMAVIAADVHAALLRETVDNVAIGGLLIEAKTQVRHGEWLPWLDSNFSMSRQTADNYRKAYRFFMANCQHVGNLHLSSAALYELSGPIDALCNEAVVAAILKEAEDKWVGVDRCWEICGEIQKAQATERATADAAERFAAGEPEPEDEPVADNDRPPPTAEPVKAGTHFATDALTNHVQGLKRIYTKQIANFLDTAVPTEDLRAVAVFLTAVADAVDKNRAQAPVAQGEKAA
jgi:Protein of unknown function (DUF3102)